MFLSNRLGIGELNSNKTRELWTKSYTMNNVNRETLTFNGILDIKNC